MSERSRPPSYRGRSLGGAGRQLGVRFRATKKVLKITHYTLMDICEMTGVKPRQVHDLRNKGALHAPTGHGRGARYDDSHVDALRTIHKLLSAGISTARIAEHLKTTRAPRLPDAVAPAEVVTARWTRVSIRQELEIGVLSGGRTDERNRALLDHLVKEARGFLERWPGKE